MRPFRIFLNQKNDCFIFSLILITLLCKKNFVKLIIAEKFLHHFSKENLHFKKSFLFRQGPVATGIF